MACCLALLLLVSLSGPAASQLVNFCQSYNNLCNFFLASVACPAGQSTNVGCTGTTAATFVGTCTCGSSAQSVDTSGRTQEDIWDYELKPDVHSRLVYRNVSNVTSVSFCASYTAACSDLLSKLDCSASNTAVVGCTGADESSFAGQCSCGQVDASTRVAELIIDDLITSSIPSLLKPNSSSPTIDGCATYAATCNALLGKIGCPVSLQTNVGCSGSDLRTFNGSCQCGGIDASTRVFEDIIDNQIKADMPGIVNQTSTNGTVNFCTAYPAGCSDLLGKLACPANQTTNTGCSGTGLDTFVGNCRCGTEAYSDTRVAELIMDVAYKSKVSASLVYSAPATTASVAVPTSNSGSSVSKGHVISASTSLTLIAILLSVCTSILVFLGS